jgi:hypothetical protein
MTESYNPIVRTFCQLRAGLLSHLDLARHEIRPGTPLESLLPEPRRREIWRELRRQGLRLPPLVRSERDIRRNGLVFGGLMLKAAVAWAVGLQMGWALLAALAPGLVAYWANRRRAVHFPLGLGTVGELVISMTNFGEHKASGYRWTRNEIELKVRLIIAESLGLPLDAVKPECTLAELGAD